ncbi:hypothetical protein KFK09_015419 [Dendrobium nobile]|uniref:Uncharacterized protein n=2 Tax=Dendrobium TaxID=37818 RepID=A0A8T3B4G2_DENNO|nr:hypothetical protein KFK09_015419 [Dendrobium nobile]PKU78053.1 hypothetical protein MA16_Dca018550 [Dendrobium catenatum]
MKTDSWVRTITSPFRKACTILKPTREKKPQTGHDHDSMTLHCEVMACGYEDVQVMWSILDKAKSIERTTNKS